MSGSGLRPRHQEKEAKPRVQAVCLQARMEKRSDPFPCAQAWDSAPGATGWKEDNTTILPFLSSTLMQGHHQHRSQSHSWRLWENCHAGVLLFEALPPPTPKTQNHSSFTLVSATLPLHESRIFPGHPPPSQLAGLPSLRTPSPCLVAPTYRITANNQTFAFLPPTHSPLLPFPRNTLMRKAFFTPACPVCALKSLFLF